MTTDSIWKNIKSQAFASKDSDWCATYIEPLAARAIEEELVLFAPNHFIAEVVASVRSDIRALLPSHLAGVVIRIGLPPDKEHKAGPASSTATSVPRTAPKTSKARVKHAAQADMLDFVWPRDQRGMPADLLRSNLFTVNRYGAKAIRPVRANEQLHTAPSYVLRVTGEETNIFDADVFAQLLHYQRNQAFGTWLWFSLRELCDDLDLAPNGPNLARVKKSLERLRDTKIALTSFYSDKKRDFIAQLVSSFWREESSANDQWCVELSKQLVMMLGPGIQTRYPVEMDRGLTSSLARYLLRFYSSHSAPIYAMKVDTLRKYCGTKQELKEFRRSMPAALKSLVDAGFLESFDIVDDKVHVVRKAASKSLGQDKAGK